MNPLRSLITRLLPTAWFSPYESANPSPRRGRVPGAAPRDTKLDLTPGTRRELVRRSRYLHKNSGFVRELVGSMAIYATGDGIKPQALSGNADWNKAAEEYLARWAARCEITSRFCFAECQSLVCRGMDVDGEYFIHKTRDRDGAPRLQLIESHRIGDADLGDTEDGIGFDVYGAPAFYRVLLDDGGFRDIPANRMLHVFEPETASGVRQAPTLQHSINHLVDEMELLALEKHAVKDNADVSRILKTERGELDEDGDFAIGKPAADGEKSEPGALQRIMGGKLVALKPGESLDSFQPNRPSPTFTGFLEHLRRDSALGHIPFEFAADSSKIGGAGVRLVVAKADRRFSYRQLILIERFLKPVWFFVIGDAIATGQLDAVENWTKVAFTTPRRVTVDAGREAQQNRADIELGIKSWEEHFAEQGMDFDEEMEIRAQNARALLTAIGIPLDDDCPYLETRELVESAERRLVTWTLKAKSICGQHDARKLIEAWHDPVWTTQNAEHPFAYITTAFRNAGLLAAEIGRLAPVALIRKGKRFALVPFDATPERSQELLTALEK